MKLPHTNWRPPRLDEDDSDSMVTSFVTDTIMILAIAMIVFIPMAQSRIAAQLKQASAAGATSQSTPIQITVSPSKLEVNVDGKTMPLGGAAGLGLFRGRSARVRILQDNISARQMTELMEFYTNAGLAAWAFEFK